MWLRNLVFGCKDSGSQAFPFKNHKSPQLILSGKSRTLLSLWGLPGDSDGKESTCNEKDPGSVPELGRSPGEGNDYPLSILAWRIFWTEDPGGIQSMGSQRVGHD